MGTRSMSGEEKFTRGECSASEFEAPHREWSPACVAQWLGNLNVPENVAVQFESTGIYGKDLKALNDTMLGGGEGESRINITEQGVRNTIIDGVKRLEQSDPTDSKDTGLFAPL